MKIINLRGTVVLTKKSPSILDRVYEILGKRVSIQLISATHCDPRNGSNGMIGKAASLEDWETKMKRNKAGGRESSFSMTFEWEESMGIPGAFLISNPHHTQFYLNSLTLEDLPDHGTLHFVCNSWVYPTHRYKYNRIFFANNAYLPCSTPEPLRHYRGQELMNLRGTSSGSLKEWDRVYDYAYYNDLGHPDKGIKYARPVLGGSREYPYPRRGRTGGLPTKSDPNSEATLFDYVPPDERFSHAKFSDFSRNALKPVLLMIRLQMKLFDKKNPKEFDTFGDIKKLYEHGFNFRGRHSLRQIGKHNHFKLANQLLVSDGDRALMFPKPDVIKANEFAWRTDEEFGREMLAGVNPVVIRRLEEFPPASKLDPNVYGNQTSSMTKEHLEENMNGLTVEQALEENKLFILDHHDAWFPYLKRINSTQSKIYATRTVLLLQDDGTLKPLAIELSLPSPMEDQNHGCISTVYTPSTDGAPGTIWQFAKAYAVVNDSGYHQNISHWLNTHAVIEPFVIAMHRQLSVVHPIYKLLRPHFRDTLNINAITRKTLINAGGYFEMTTSPGKYAMEMSSAIYKNWVFTEQALPADLLKRGVAVKDPREPHGVRLLIDDYPFAVDGLEIWSAIQVWVDEYCCIYYPSDEMVKHDSELQSWWMELRTEGHGDKKDEPWWPRMETRAELIDSCTIIIWVASALHAAVNFGQYNYAGYTPNRPCISRRFMPFAHEVESDPEKAFLKTFTNRFQTLMGMTLMEILSMHSTDEIYLGQNESPYWTSDDNALQAFERFGKKLVEIEDQIMKRNNDQRFKNRSGLVRVPYTLLCPNTSDYTHLGGLIRKGIPNSISI